MTSERGHRLQTITELRNERNKLADDLAAAHEALREVDTVIRWIALNHPVVVDKMPPEVYGSLRRAAALAAGTERNEETPRPPEPIMRGTEGRFGGEAVSAEGVSTYVARMCYSEDIGKRAGARLEPPPA